MASTTVGKSKKGLGQTLLRCLLSGRTGLCKLRFLRTADFGAQRSIGASVCDGLNGRFRSSGTVPLQTELRPGFRPP